MNIYGVFRMFLNKTYGHESDWLRVSSSLTQIQLLTCTCSRSKYLIYTREFIVKLKIGYYGHGCNGPYGNRPVGMSPDILRRRSGPSCCVHLNVRSSRAFVCKNNTACDNPNGNTAKGTTVHVEWGGERAVYTYFMKPSVRLYSNQDRKHGVFLFFIFGAGPPVVFASN